MSRELLLAPESISGISLSSIHNEQGIKYISALTHHMRKQGTVGNLMVILLQTCQLLSGRVTSIFEKPFVSLDYLQEFKQK